MTGPSTEEHLRAHVRSTLGRANLSQAEAARSLGISTKHMCQMLTGRATLTLDWADRIVGLCGKRLVITVKRPYRRRS